MTTPDDDLVIDFVPPLVALLLAAEREKGSSLTEAEVVDIRDSATCMRVPRSMSQAMAERRGYPDIHPERAFEEWQAVRALLGD